MANLARFGLALELLLELPRGVFEPDSGSGRLLIGLGPRGGRRPVIGSATEDPESVAALLQAVEREGANTTER